MSEKKKFTIQSPYSDYAADNDMVSDAMENNAASENVKPDAKAIIRSALTALAVVLLFAAGTLMCTCIGNCVAESTLPPIFAGVQNFEVTEDGSSIIIETEVYDSVNFVMAYEAEYRENGLYLTLYSRKTLSNEAADEPNVITLTLDGSVQEIYFVTDDSESADLVLQRDAATGEWQQAE